MLGFPFFSTHCPSSTIRRILAIRGCFFRPRVQQLPNPHSLSSAENFRADHENLLVHSSIEVRVPVKQGQNHPPVLFSFCEWLSDDKVRFWLALLSMQGTLGFRKAKHVVGQYSL